MMGTFAFGQSKQSQQAQIQIAPGVNDTHFWQEEC